MIYNLNSGYMPDLIDSYRTGNYGEDSYAGHMICSSCSEIISEGERHFEVEGNVYCMNCEDAADEQILDMVRENYIYEM